MQKIILLIIFFITHAGAALANDSSATWGVGGLELKKSDSIAILSEKLRISTSLITVDYEMQNISDEPIETILAFPLPPLSGPEVANVPVETVPEMSENYVAFKTIVDGIPVKPEKEVRAFKLEESGERGREITKDLLEAKILISPLEKDFFERLKALPPEAKKRFVDEKLLDLTDQEYPLALWTVDYTFYSKHRFEPGKVVKVHHEYTPVTGRTFYGDFFSDEDTAKWCLDARTKAAVTKLLKKHTTENNNMIDLKTVDYILKTGANWAGPIRYFELTIDKGDPKTIISLCAEGLKRISDKEFQLIRKDFIPTNDISVAFFMPLPPLE